MNFRCEIAESGEHRVRLPELAFCRKLQHTADNCGDALPVARFLVELFPAGFGNGIKLRFAIIVGGSPGGGDVAALHEANERGVDGALIDAERFFADLSMRRAMP